MTEAELARNVATAILGVDTLWGGNVLEPSGTGRYIADSWFSDEPLPEAYTHPAAAKLRAAGGLSARERDGAAIDIGMPQMDGFEVCRRLKQDEALRGVPVIFLSALSDALDKVKAFFAGGVDYVTKPFQIEELESRVATHLALRRLQLEIEERNRELAESYARLQALEQTRQKLTQMIVHDLRAPSPRPSTMPPSSATRPRSRETRRWRWTTSSTPSTC